MLTWLYLHALTVSAAAACGFAIWKGGAAERFGGFLVGGAWIASLLIYPLVSLSGAAAPYVPFAVDAVGAIGFLVLAVRYPTPWLGVAVLLQAAALTLTAAFLTVDGYGSQFYIAQENMIGAALLLLLVGATVRAWMRRRKGGRSADGVDGLPNKRQHAVGDLVAERT